MTVARSASRSNSAAVSFSSSPKTLGHSLKARCRPLTPAVPKTPVVPPIPPIELYLAGRATAEYRGVAIPVEELAVTCCRAWLAAHLHALDAECHVRVHCLFRPGSSNLVELFARQHRGARPLANDTSLGVGFAPASPLEIESFAGKNPITHVGKLYNAAATRIAEDLVAGLDGVHAADVLLVSRIGAPIEEPQIVHLRLRAGGPRRAAELAPGAGEIARRHLAAIDSMWAELVARNLATGEVTLGGSGPPVPGARTPT